MKYLQWLALFACMTATPDVYAQDIAEIEIETNAARVDGDPTTFFVMAFLVEGSGFSSVDVTPPGGTPLALSFDPGEGAFTLESNVFTSLAALRAQFPLGNYLFDLGFAGPSFALPLSDVEPPGFADITHPAHNGLAFAVPTLSWTVCSGCPAVAAVDVGLERLSNGDVLFETAFFPASSGSISFMTGMATPTPVVPLPPLSALMIGEEYEMGVDIVRGTSVPMNLAGDDFEYSTSFRKDLDVRFSVAGVDVTCTGDGGGGAGCTPCPCGNDAPVGTIGGCLNSANTSAQLVRSGSPNVSNDTLRFEVRSATPNGPPGGLAASGGFAVGQTRRFQAFYREDPALVCGRGQNTTNATSITFF